MLYLHRFRPTQTKTRKTKAESKLEFFGFEDKEDQLGEDGSDAAMAGKSNYKIKYFGFDDLSESDSDDESSQAKEKKAKKAAAALAALCSSVDSPHTSDSQDSQASSNTGEQAYVKEVKNRIGDAMIEIYSTSCFFFYWDILDYPDYPFGFSQQIILTMMNPVLEDLRGRKDAQGSRVTNPRMLDSKKNLQWTQKGI